MAWHSTMISERLRLRIVDTEEGVSMHSYHTYNYPQGRRRQGFCFIIRNHTLTLPPGLIVISRTDMYI